ncbi:MAG: hypothetical protein H0W84_09355 [Bacteroidetes bacterium]|nr:hypothetical protein [Bacteroidota bacterium]
MRSGIEYKFDIDKIKSAAAVTWFCWDYSHLIINDPNVIAKEIKTKSIPYWFNKLEKQNFGSNKVKKLFKKKTFTDDPRTVQSLILSVSDDKFLEIYRVPLDIDSVKQIVKNYKNNRRWYWSSFNS